MRRAIETNVSRLLLWTILAIGGVLAATGCDSQGVPFQPQDTVPEDTTTTDGTASDLPGGTDVVEGWDWWAGDLLVWRAEQLPLKEVFHDIDGVSNATGFEVYAVGFRGAVLRMDSAVGVWEDVSPATSHSIEGVWAVGPKQAWICGEKGLLMRYEKAPGASYAEWIDETEPGRSETIYSIHGTGPDDIWAVGDGGLILHRTAAGWTQIPHTDLGLSATDVREFRAVWAAAPELVYLGGERWFGTWDGVEWSKYWSSGDTFVSLAGNGEHIWLGSDGGYLWHYDGENWIKQTATIYYDYNAVWVQEDGTVYATGEDPSPQSIIWIGKKDPWEQLEVASPEGVAEQWEVTGNSLITGLWGHGPEDLFACTQQQQILRYSTHE